MDRSTEIWKQGWDANSIPNATCIRSILNNLSFECLRETLALSLTCWTTEQLNHTEMRNVRMWNVWISTLHIWCNTICDRNGIHKHIHKKVLTGKSGIEELKLYRGQFWTCFRMSMGQFTLLQMLVPHLGRRSSNYLTSPADWYNLACHLLLFCTIIVIGWQTLALVHSAMFSRTDLHNCLNDSNNHVWLYF